jgi:hypothetical protein
VAKTTACDFLCVEIEEQGDLDRPGGSLSATGQLRRKSGGSGRW